MRTVRVTAQVNRWGERIYEGVPNDIVDTVVRDLVSKGFEVRQFHSSQKYGLTRIEDLEDLRLVGLGILRDLVARQRRSRLRSSGGIADQTGEITDEKHHAMPEVLEVFHLAQQDRVPEVQVGRRGIEANFDGQWLSGLRKPFELRAQLAGANDVHASFREICQLLVDSHQELEPRR